MSNYFHYTSTVDVDVEIPYDEIVDVIVDKMYYSEDEKLFLDYFRFERLMEKIDNIKEN